MIKETLAHGVLTAALETGADFAEIFIENTDKSSVHLTNNSIDAAQSGIDFGLGLRIIKGERMVYSYTNDLSETNLIACAKNASKALASDNNIMIKVLDFTKKDYSSISLHKPLVMPSDVNKKNISEMLLSASSAAFAHSNLITQTSISYLHNIQNVCIINSKGLWSTDKRVRTRTSINAVASNETEKQSAHLAPGALKGFELYNDISLEDYAKEAARSAVTMLNAKECPAHKMPVVLDNGFGGVIFHEACGHGLEAVAIAKGTSVFCNKLGEKIASEKLTAIDDGTLKNSWGSINIDDEGTPAQKNILIENGILKGYMVDRFNGQKINMQPTGSSRRESYKFIPTSRMTNTYIAPGNDKKDDIISSIDYGLYAKYMGGGSVNTATGEFNFAVSEAYIIKNGEISEPVRGATLIGKGSEVLQKIDMISDNLSFSEGMCGASSGSVPVNVGQPMLRVSEITVGGRG